MSLQLLLFGFRHHLIALTRSEEAPAVYNQLIPLDIHTVQTVQHITQAIEGVLGIPVNIQTFQASAEAEGDWQRYPDTGSFALSLLSSLNHGNTGEFSAVPPATLYPMTRISLKSDSSVYCGMSADEALSQHGWVQRGPALWTDPAQGGHPVSAAQALDTLGLQVQQAYRVVYPGQRVPHTIYASSAEEAWAQVRP